MAWSASSEGKRAWLPEVQSTHNLLELATASGDSPLLKSGRLARIREEMSEETLNNTLQFSMSSPDLAGNYRRWQQRITAIGGSPDEGPIASPEPSHTPQALPNSPSVDNSTAGPRARDQFFKTKICIPFASGHCRRGKTCCFAHGQQELRHPLNLQKTKLCEAWLKSQCTNDNCSFAHGEGELRSTADYYKTGLCKYWKRGLKCEAGADCRHAHGTQELRPRRTERDKKETNATSSQNSSLKDVSEDRIHGDVPSPRTSGTRVPSHNDLFNYMEEPLENGQQPQGCCTASAGDPDLAPFLAGKVHSTHDLKDLEDAVDKLLTDGGLFSLTTSHSQPILARPNIEGPARRFTESPSIFASGMHTRGGREQSNEAEAFPQNPRPGLPRWRIMTSSHPMFDSTEAVTIIIDDSYVQCNIMEEKRLTASQFAAVTQSFCTTSSVEPPTDPCVADAAAGLNLSEIIRIFSHTRFPEVDITAPTA